MVLQRDIGTVDPDWLETDPKHHFFVRIELPEETLRFTTRRRDWTGALDAANGEGSSATWRGGDCTPEDIRVSQTNVSALEVSSVTFGNVEVDGDAGPWLVRDRTVGLKNRRITVWQAVWPPDDDTDAGIGGVYLLFVGRIGSREHGERTTLRLLPFRSSWNIRMGSQILPTVCRFAVAGKFKDPFSCQYAGADTTCGGSLAECIEKDNEVNFGGHPLMMKPNTQIFVGGQRFMVG